MFYIFYHTHLHLDITPEHLKDITTIMRSCENAESAKIPTMLKKIAYSIQKNKNYKDFCSINAEHGVQWLKENNLEAYKLLQKFLETHPHRGHCEVINSTFYYYYYKKN